VIVSGYRQNVQRPWWLWRLSPYPKKRLATDLLLPLGYTAPEHVDAGSGADTARPVDLMLGQRSYPRRAARAPGVSMHHAYRPDLFEEAPEVGQLLERLELELGQRGLPTNGHVTDDHIGTMLTMKVDAMRYSTPTPAPGSRGSRVLLWLTPPVVPFADLSKHFTEDQLREAFGGHRYLAREHIYSINREVFETTGQFFRGTLDAGHRPIKVKDTEIVAREPGEAGEIAKFLLVALDAFLANDGADPRFNPRSGPTPRARRPNAPATVTDVIEVAMDIVAERREGWRLAALSVLRQINLVEYLGGSSKALSIAQCIRRIEAPANARAALYRIWGKTRLTKEPSPGTLYVIVSTSFRMTSHGETAIFLASADANQIPEDEFGGVWPMTLDPNKPKEALGGWANFSGVSTHEEALSDAGVSVVVPCDARVRGTAEI
jgi:hypothetical protein